MCTKKCVDSSPKTITCRLLIASGQIVLILLSCSLLLGFFIPSYASAVPFENLMLTVRVNGVERGEYLAVRTADGDFLFRPEDLKQMGLTLGDKARTVNIDATPYAALRSIPDTTYIFDEKAVSLAITFNPELLPASAIDLTMRPRPPRTRFPGETSAFLNYGVNYSAADPGERRTTLYEKFGFSANRYLFLTDSQYETRNGEGRFVRLMSNLSYEQDEALRRTVIGDQFAASGELGSTINVGGAGIAKIYSMDPYFIQYPTPSLTGVVALPSQVELYHNGMLMSRQQVEPGKFDLKNFYYYSGAGNLEILIRDPYGNVQKITQSSYFSTSLLRKGLHEYSYTVGFRREQFGVESNEYGKAAFSAFHRYGLSNSLNIGASAEASSDIRNVGFQGAAVIPRGGIVTAAVSGSQDNNDTGSAVSVAHSYQYGGFLNTNIFSRQFSRNYATLATSDAVARTKYQRGIGANYSSRLGSFSVNYVLQDNFAGNQSKTASASYIKSLSPATMLNISGTSVREQQSSRHEVFVTLSLFTDRKYQHAATYRRSDSSTSETLYTSKNIPTGEGVGYRLTVNRTERDSGTTYTAEPYIQVNGRYGTYSAEYLQRRDDQNRAMMYQLNAAGAIVYAGGFWGMTRPVNNSFTFVSVDSIPDAAVTSDSEVIGRTNKNGMMIVPSLQAYYTHEIGVDARNLSLDYGIAGGISKNISLPQWSGACVAFNANKIRAVVGSLMFQEGERLIPLEFQEFSLQHSGTVVPFHSGRAGEFYMENILPENGKSGSDSQSCRAIAERRAGAGNTIKPGTYPASAEYRGRKCTFSITFPETEDVMTDLGVIVCNPEAADVMRAEPAVAVPVSAVPAAALPAEGLDVSSLEIRLDKSGGLTRRQKNSLADFARMLTRDPELEIVIETYGSPEGQDQPGRRIRLKTLTMIKRDLSKMGVPSNRIQEFGKSSRQISLCEENGVQCGKEHGRLVIKLVRPGDHATGSE
jgi:outer membrane usher protein